MKFLSVLATVFLLFFTSILILGVVSGSESEVNSSIIIEAPQVVILKELINFGSYYKWCPNITKSDYDPDSAIRNSIYVFDGYSIPLTEKVQNIFTDNKVIFIEHKNNSHGYFHSIINEIYLTENSDGTTEVHWTMRYSLHTIMGKILNIFKVRSVVGNMLNENLKALKEKFEQ